MSILPARKKRKTLFIILVVPALLVVVTSLFVYLWLCFHPVHILVNFNYIEINKEQLLGYSDIVIVGTAGKKKTYSQSSFNSPYGKDVLTNTDFTVDEYLYNPENLNQKKIRVQMPGGRTGIYDVEVSDQVKFVSERKYLLFLRLLENDVYFVATGPAGTYEVLKDGFIGAGESEKNIFNNLFDRNMFIDEMRKEIKNITPVFPR